MSTQLENWVSNPEETHGPLMSVAIWSLCGISGFFLCLRLFIQHGQGKLWYDSLLLTISWVSQKNEYMSMRRFLFLLTRTHVQLFLLVQVILCQLNINLGFGKHSLDSKGKKYKYAMQQV